MIRVEKLTKSYRLKGRRHYVFRNLSFEIPEKTNLGILGINGAGKSTLLRILGGIDHPDSAGYRRPARSPGLSVSAATLSITLTQGKTAR